MSDEMLSVYRQVHKITDAQWINIRKAIHKRHYRDNWFYNLRNWNGNVIRYITADCQDWIQSVYLNNENSWIENEISFSLRIISRRLSEEEINKCLEYKDMTAKEIASFLKCDISDVYKEIKYLEELDHSMIYLNNKNTKTVTTSGVRMLEQVYHKRNYWKRLEEIRLCMNRKMM